MKFETLKSGKFGLGKQIGLVVSLFVLVLIGSLTIYFSYAKYRATQSLPLATGTVNYSLADFSVLSVYLQKASSDGTGLENQYDRATNDNIPSTGYDLNTQKSYCTAGTSNERVWGEGYKGPEEKVKVTYEGGSVSFTNITKSNTRCYLWFDVSTKGTGEKTLASMDLHKNGDIDKITGTACGSCDITTQNGLYETEDDDGKSYIFRGTVTNNWVKFGKTSDNKDIYWRIIRINGDGTIRLIYSGFTGSFGSKSNGTNALNSQAYNTAYDDNTYVGYYYGTKGGNSFSATHSNTTPSSIASATETWFTGTNLDELTQLNHIDENAGFCNNRQISSTPQQWWTSEPTSGERGTSKIVTAYKGWYKAFDTGGSWRTAEQYPDLKCSTSTEKFEENADYKRDYYTWAGHAKRGNQKLKQPVGLITMDEVILAGGFGGKNNTGYWLYTGEYYWTMSPNYFDGTYAQVFFVNTNGALNYNYVGGSYGVRPVINLKADTKFTFQDSSSATKGTNINPYIVSG